MIQDVYSWFSGEFQKLSGLNLECYKEKQMRRRVETYMETHGFRYYPLFLDSMQQDSRKLADFMDFVTINVTEFFRTGNHWSFFEESVLPQLVRRFGKGLRIWSAGCSSGEEPYSLAMSLSRYIPYQYMHITATDIDDNILKKAEAGVFSRKALESVSPILREKWFTPVAKPSGASQILTLLRNCVEFRKLDITQDPFPEGCDLIVCRNVMIYFTETVKKQIFQRFYESLNRGGCLFLGSSEQIVLWRQQGYRKVHSSIYIKE